ncbi:alanine--tRNA ligase cytoplasmic-like isoform X1 [Biomphalaria glabrata]
MHLLKILKLYNQLILYRPGHFKLTSRWSSWSSKDVRSTFINYFISEDHTFIPPLSVIPKKREGTYFINSGMNQFKPIFLGECDPTDKFVHLKRAVNSQKCIRVGGKHNDLEDVGHDLTHHTFFEMLGNWSFGDYFKVRVCQMAFHLLTKEFKVPVERLYFTYFGGDKSLNLSADEECRQIWRSLGIPADRLIPFGLKDNFWEMGLSGPCGPCTEIHYDHRGSVCSPAEVNSGSPDVVEIWNLVFMQYNRLPDSSLVPLPTHHVDTGMGLERMVAVLNGTADNYSTDLFLPLFKEIEKLSGCPEYKGNLLPLDTSYRLLADHTRMFTVAISDGLLPSQDNLGHKLRSLLVRCVDLCRKVFHTDPLTTLPLLVSRVRESLGSVYPEIEQSEKKVCDIVQATIHHYDKHKEQAMKSFNKMLSKHGNIKVLPGDIMLQLEHGGYFGKPMAVEMISELASTLGISLDMDGYTKLCQSTKADISTLPLTSLPDRASSLVNQMLQLGVAPTDDSYKYSHCSLGDGVFETDFLTDFTQMLEVISPVHVRGISKDNCLHRELLESDVGEVVLDKTCFYSEAGGQEADQGELVSETGTFQVTDVQRKSGYIVHYGHMRQGTLQIGQQIEPRIYQEIREGCMRNHTATHLLQSALTDLLPSTQQQGSSITSHKLTFNFLALSALDSKSIQQTQAAVQSFIKKEYLVSRTTLPLEVALKIPNVKVLQNEKYPEEVSVISIGPENGSFYSSVELCGGTHVLNTSDLEDFCITQMTSKAQNVKRVTCVTGSQAQLAHLNGSVLRSMCQLLEDLIKHQPGQNHSVKQSLKYAQQVLHALGAQQERLEHSLHLLAQNVSDYYARLKNLNEENQKTRSLMQSYIDILKKIATVGHEEQDIKQLFTLIRKIQQVELVPKVVREEVHSCLVKNEQKVTEMINKKNISHINQLIEDQFKRFPDSSVVSLTVNDIDINHRQITKSLSKQMLSKCVILLNQCHKTTDLFISLPLSSFQPLVDEDLDELKALLKVEAKGKLSAQNSTVAIYTFHLQGEINHTNSLISYIENLKPKQ